jgi:type IV secretory pathway VirB6-like protein
MNERVRNIQNVGYGSTIFDSPYYQRLFADDNIAYIQATVRDNLTGLLDRPILVSKPVIESVLSELFKFNSPQLGDIFTIDTIPQEVPRDDILDLINNTINIITNHIRTEYEMIENNQKLTIWTSLYGNFNDHGLRAHPQIKIKNKRTPTMQFNMRY